MTCVSTLGFEVSDLREESFRCGLVASGFKCSRSGGGLMLSNADFGIPVYVAAAPKFDGSSIHFASAAHPDPCSAAIRNSIALR
jgi:hypothetical protein